MAGNAGDRCESLDRRRPVYYKPGRLFFVYLHLLTPYTPRSRPVSALSNSAVGT